MARSLVASASCPRCSAPLVEISLEQAGQAMVMRSCSTCDTRWWCRDGEHVDLGAVLDTVASAKKAPRTTAWKPATRRTR